VNAFNSNDLEYLANMAPREISKGSDVEEFLRRKNQQFVEHNLRLREGRTKRLANEGACRTCLPPPRRGARRVGDPIWSSAIHQIGDIDRSVVVDEEGRRYPINEALPVNPQSTQPQVMGRGLDLNRQRRKEALEAQRIELENALGAVGGTETVRNLTRSLRQTNLFDELRRAGIGDRRTCETFICLCPSNFAFVGSGAVRSIRLK
jgi:hypothetical protein